MSDEVLEQYIGRVMRISEAEELDEEALKQMALEVGITEEELQRAEWMAAEHVSRAEGFLRHRRSADAVEELQEALALKPADYEVRRLLARAYLEELRGGRQEAAKQAEGLVRQCLLRRPDDDELFGMLNEIDSLRGASAGGGPGRGVYWAGVAAAVVGLSAAAWWWMAEEPPETAPDAEAWVGTEIGGYTKLEEVEETVPEISPPSGAFTLSLGGQFTEELTMEVHDVTHDVYSDSAWLRVSGWIVNEGGNEWSTMEGRVIIYDEDGEGLKQSGNVRVVQTYNAALRPGDRMPFNALVRSQPEAARATLMIERGERVPAADTYPAGTPVEVGAGEGVRLGEDQLMIRERSAAFRDTQILNTRSFRASFEIENRGPPLRSLSLTLELVDGAGNVVYSRDRSLTSSSGPPLLQGETRLFGTVATQLPLDAVGYRLVVSRLQ